MAQNYHSVASGGAAAWNRGAVASGSAVVQNHSAVASGGGWELAGGVAGGGGTYGIGDNTGDAVWHLLGDWRRLRFWLGLFLRYGQPTVAGWC